MTASRVVFAACAVLAASLAAQAQEQERSMGVRQPPDTVFDVPVEQVVPRLAGAEPTGRNGRVGGELVFWGYELADGRIVNFFACAVLSDVDCDARIGAICPVRTEVLERGEYEGTVLHRQCREVGFAAPGDLRPGCTDHIYESGLIVGLAACG